MGITKSYNLLLFKSELEKLLSITDWSPTALQLQKIAEQINKGLD